MIGIGAEIVVIGGGAAGCLMARRLADLSGAHVVVLEAGPDIRDAVPTPLRDGWTLPSGDDWPYDWGFKSEPDASGATNTLRRGRLVGGTSWLTRFAVRGPRADIDAWGGPLGWGYDALLPSFRRLEADLEFGDRAWHGSDGPIAVTRYPEQRRSEIHMAARQALNEAGLPFVDDLNDPDAIGIGAMPMSSRDGARITSVDAFLAPESARPGVEVRADSVVDRVLLRSGRAVGVRLASGEEVSASLVMLSAGVYGSPAVLLRSGIGPAEELAAHGIRVEVELPGVGKNLRDHPGAEFEVKPRSRGIAGHLLHTIATFRSSGRPASAGPDLMFWLTDPAGEDDLFEIGPILLKPESRGTVRLRSSDPEAAPRITLPGLSDDRDVERLVDGHEVALDALARAPLRDLVLTPTAASRGGAGKVARNQLRAAVKAGAYSVPHVVGTCAGGSTPESGAVVDERGRVHGIEGLAVIDASILPESPAGFPHILVLALADHLAPGLVETSRSLPTG